MRGYKMPSATAKKKTGATTKITEILLGANAKH